jgi:protoporphyrinogen IX oxidase
MIALVKLVHITAIVVWSAGLLALPGFYSQLSHLRAERPEIGPHGEAVLRLQRAVRLTYVGIVSPAAFIAVGSGILLIFQQGVVAPWLSLKLALVTGLVITHSLTGITLVRLFEHPNGYPRWRYVGATSAAFATAATIVALTLTKPVLSDALLPAAFSKPGALKPLVESVNPWQRP